MTPEEKKAKRAAQRRAWKRAYREANKDKVNAALRAWTEKNRERRNAQKRAWHAANKEKINAARLGRNREQINANARVRYEATGERKRLLQKANHANIRARRRGRPGKLATQDWLKVLERFDYRCGICGTTEELTLDHIVPLINEASTNTPDNIGVLCSSHNTAKGDKLIKYGPYEG